MSGEKSKVKFNIKNVHYAVIEEGGSFGTPVAMPGAVSLSLEQQGEITPFYADGIVFYQSASNGGYSGDLEVALVPDEFRKDVLQEEEDTNKVLFENANKNGKSFALGFQIDGDKEPTLFWFFKCTATRPNVESETTEDTKEPGTDTITISCAPDENGDVRAKTQAGVAENIRTEWFDEVYTKNKVQA